MYRRFNPNPDGARVGDCVVRALCAATGKDWTGAFISLSLHALCLMDMPSANRVLGECLRENGFERHALPESCPACYTVEDFAREHPRGVFVLAADGHVVCVRDGDWMDTWDSGREAPAYYWARKDDA